jgi:hypothetical protein
MNPQIKEYLAFMQWFQTNYPIVYDHFWKCISIPIANTNADTDCDNKTLKIEVSLQWFIAQYYTRRTC